MSTMRLYYLLSLLASAQCFSGGFRTPFRISSVLSLASSDELSKEEKKESYTAVPGMEGAISPTVTDKARTIAHVCSSATLSTLCSGTVTGEAGCPFGSYVDYILNDDGWPVLLLSEQSVHTQNVEHDPRVSMFAQLPRSRAGQTTAALSCVSFMGTVVDIDEEERDRVTLAFTLVHPYAEQIVDSPKFKFKKIKPDRIYFSGGFGVMATWVRGTIFLALWS